MESINLFVVIVAGGNGSRMATATPKQYLKLHHQPILYYSLKAFCTAFPKATLVLVHPENDQNIINDIIHSLAAQNKIITTTGGNNRFESVKKGLEHVPLEAWVMVHDAVRPLISSTFLNRCLNAAIAQGNAIPALQVKDSMRVWSPNGFQNINRDMLRSIQTPQTFNAAILKKAFEQDYHNLFTDEASVVERLGETLNLIEGEQYNIKITYPEDLIIAESLMQHYFKMLL